MFTRLESRWILAVVAAALYAGCSHDDNSPGDGGIADGPSADLTPSPPDLSPLTTVVSSAGAAGFNSETDLVVTPAGRVVIVWIAVTGSPDGIGYAVSDDLGATFTKAHVVRGAAFSESSDPKVSVAPNGDVTLVFLSFDRDASGMPNETHLFEATLASGTTTFSAAVETDAGFHELRDKPGVIVTHSGARLVCMSSTDQMSTIEFLISRSTDGLVFSETNLLGMQAQAFYNLCNFCEDDVTHEIHVVTIRFGQSSTVVGFSSTNDGATFGSEVQIAATTDQANQHEPTCVAHDGQWTVLYGTDDGLSAPETTPTSATLVLARQSKGQATFAQEQVLSGSATDLLALWRIAGLDAAGQPTLFGYSATGETGPLSIESATFQSGTWKRRVLGSAGFFVRSRASQKWLGDYIAAALHQLDTMLASYVDNHSGSARVAFLRAAVP